MKSIETFVLGMVQVNTYLLWNDDHVLVIDPGSKSLRLQEAIDKRNGIVDGIVLTHAHFDHIAGVDTLVNKYHCPLYMNDLDIPLVSIRLVNLLSDTLMHQVTAKAVVCYYGMIIYFVEMCCFKVVSGGLI